jgi:glycosyltransferase involved in cell wall biosynthesis
MAAAPRVLMVTGEYPPAMGGVGDYTAVLCRQLELAGATISVLTGRLPGSPTTTPSEKEPHLFRVVRRWGYGSLEKVSSVASKQGCNVVHLQYQAAAFDMHPSANLLPAYLRARLPGTKVVTTFHDLRVPYLFPKAGPLRPRALRTMDGFSHASVLTNEPDLAELGGAEDGGKKRRLIPIGSNVENAPPPDFDRRLWRRQLGADEDTLLVSYFGFMNDTKGVEYLVQALGLLLGRGVQLKLLVVGGETGETDPTNRSYSQRVHHLIQSRHMEDRVYWTGYVSAQQVSAALLSSDICALPFRDGVSVRRGSLLAAILHGLPVVTTFPEKPEPLLVNGENLAMVERDSPKALADTIEALWRDPADRERLSTGATRLAERFTWPEIAARHMEMYEALLDG